MPRTADKLRERKFDRMRLGQAVATIKQLPSDPDVYVALVPLTEAEHYQCIEIITAMEAPDNIVGAHIRDRRNSNEVLLRALREKDNLDERMFDDLDEMMEILNVEDINLLMDAYFEMLEEISPSAGALTDEEIDQLKKVLETIHWKDLSGRQWYALRNFLSAIGFTLLPDNLLGSQSTNLLTLTNESEESTPTASPSSDNSPAKSAESQS